MYLQKNAEVMNLDYTTFKAGNKRVATMKNFTLYTPRLIAKVKSGKLHGFDNPTEKQARERYDRPL